MCAEPINSNANIFSIEDPDNYMCNIVGFYLGHRILEIKMIHSKKGGYLVASFNFVSFFSGPTSWQGANFQIAPVEQFMSMKYTQNLHRDIGTSDKEFTEYLAKTRHLYTVTPTDIDIQVQIFASQARIESHVSESG